MSNRISPEVRQIVASRANFVCEYCLISEEDAYLRFQVEHIISRKHGGSSKLENLALACVFCNRYKGSDVASLSEATVRILQMNHNDQILERRVLSRRGRYPSEAALLLTTEH